MKVLQINNFYNYGSTGKITHDIHVALLEMGHDSFVCYGRGASSSDHRVFKICSEFSSKWNNVRSRITGILYGGFSRSTQNIKKIIEHEKPDVVHLQCLNCFFINIYDLIQWLNTKHIKTVLTLHAEFMYTANCGYALDCERWVTGCGACPRLKKETRSLFLDKTHESFDRMLKAFQGFNENLFVVSVSPWLEERARKSPILSGFHHKTIYNGIDIDIFSRRDVTYLREKYSARNRKVVLHVTAKFKDDPSHIKGGVHLIELARNMPDVLFLVAGKSEVISPLPENLVVLGSLNDQRLLADYYSLADAFVLTSKKETFSMPCAESLCCGTPVFGFKAGAPEMISLKEYSSFVEQGSVNELAAKLRAYFDNPPFDPRSIERTAHNIYSRRAMVENYLRVYESISKLSDGDLSE